VQGAEGDFAVVVGADGDRGWSVEVEIAAIPYIISASTMRQRPISWHPAGAVAPSAASASAPDCRRQREGEGPADAVAATEPGLVLPGDGLEPAECLLDALADSRQRQRRALGLAAPPLTGALHKVLPMCPVQNVTYVSGRSLLSNIPFRRAFYADMSGRRAT
jgi:hypothetical protein